MRTAVLQEERTLHLNFWIFIMGNPTLSWHLLNNSGIENKQWEADSSV